MYSVSTFIEISNIERKQSLSFCFVDSSVSTSVDVISVSENTHFYKKKQSLCSSVDAIAIVVVNIDALTLIADMIEKKKSFACMSLLNLILLFVHLFVEYLISISKHKKLSKMKIKKLSKSKHIESRSQQIVAEISIEFTYKIALFFDIQHRLKSLR